MSLATIISLITNGETRKFLEYKDLETNFSIANLFIVEANFSNDGHARLVSINRSLSHAKKLAFFSPKNGSLYPLFMCTQSI